MVAPSKNEVLHNGGRRKNEYTSTTMSVVGVVPSGTAHWERQFMPWQRSKLLLFSTWGRNLSPPWGLGFRVLGFRV
jgi:hypothetical protein